MLSAIIALYQTIRFLVGFMAQFHLAIPIHNIEVARHFYEVILGCPVGRTAERWVDINFWEHQVSLHLVDTDLQSNPTNDVDADQVPVRHFGLILEWAEWEALRDRLVDGEFATDIQWVIEPKIRFVGEVGEQATMFIRDPSNNCLEFKSFKEMSQVFAY